MFTIGRLSRFPAKFKDREKTIQNIVKYNISQTETGIIIVTSTTGQYEQKIEIYDNIIHMNSKCKFYCTCPSFKFEFAYSAFQQDALADPEKFLQSIAKKPKDKNQFGILSGCKHLVALARHCFKIKIK